MVDEVVARTIFVARVERRAVKVWMHHWAVDERREVGWGGNKVPQNLEVIKTLSLEPRSPRLQKLLPNAGKKQFKVVWFS